MDSLRIAHVQRIHIHQPHRVESNRIANHHQTNIRCVVMDDHLNDAMMYARLCFRYGRTWLYRHRPLHGISGRDRCSGAVCMVVAGSLDGYQ